MSLSLQNLLPFFILFFVFTPLLTALNPDGLSLLALKAAIETDPHGVLVSWSESDSTPCHWAGIACTRNRVTELYLPSKGFNGYIPSEIGRVDSLKRIILSHNNFSKLIPAQLFNATNLVDLDLSHNSLSGSIPYQIRELKTLKHIDLSSNFLNGSLPEALVELDGLVGTLNLSYNRFTGEVPASYGHFPVVVSLDLRHNNLTGKLPQVGSLLNQGPTAFSGNPGLCGFPLETLCPEAQNSSTMSNTSTEEPQKPLNVIPNLPNGDEEREKEGGGSVTVPIISGISVVIGAVSVSVWLFRRKWTARSAEGKVGKEKVEVVEEVNEEGQDGKFVVMDEGFNLELEDLLRASAYVVGRSRSGIVYKVVAGAGRGLGVTPTVVAVRRLSEGDATWRLKEFESEMEAIAKVNHPNIVRLRAYYYATDEKLLVTDYIRNCNLYSALHGVPSSSSSPLSWEARLRIAQGTARGLMYIHECSPRKHVHGSLKSTKILLDEDFQPYIAGFGIARLALGFSKLSTSSSKRSNSNITSGLKISALSNTYLAPEARIFGSKFTQKCDVYSFGVMLLEILTGRHPDEGPENDGKGLEGFVRKIFREERPLSEIIDPALLHEVHAKKQVNLAFHIALNCTELDPEVRPRMRTVSESLDRIKLQ